MLLLLLSACGGSWTPAGPTVPPLDLTTRLGADEVRAGVVTDAAALFGGISAEGKPGDVKLYNDRVQFVIQAPGESSFYVEYGGGLIDADLVREAGVPGRDIVDELTPMVGLGRIVDAESVTVLADGSDGDAVVRVEGRGAPMRLVTGALESEAVVPDLELRIRTDFMLAPGAWSLRAETTVWNEEDEALDLSIGEVALLAADVGEAWRPGTGRGDPSEATTSEVGAFTFENEVALLVTGDGAEFAPGAVERILTSLAPGIAGFGPTESVAAGDSLTWSRWIGVGPDLATLTGERLRRDNLEAQLLTGTVTADGPVAGARVHVLDGDGAPITVAVTDTTGAWSAIVPAGPVRVAASGRGRSIQVDLPEGRGWVSPYEADLDATLATLADGAPAIPFAEGYGVTAAQESLDLTLTAPGVLHVEVADGGPAVVRAAFATGDTVVVDERLVPGRPNGLAALGFLRDGAMDLRLEPGTYDVTVYRGVRDELWREQVTVASDETTTVSATILPAYTIDGVLTIDPHAHASPSGDGSIPMADRLLVTAANGIDVHVGTDHDHVVDYRPLLAPMALDDRLVSIVADEVSPVLRGHFNVWPAAVDASRPNGGAPMWWLGYADTAEIFGWMREMVGADGIVQANHPVGSSGMFSLAGYDALGQVDQGDHWSDDFDAMELLNSGDWESNLPYYLDLVNRGKLVVPVGVSDTHSHTGGDVGANLTFLHTGGRLADLDDDALRAAMAAGATVVSRGPYIDARVGGAWAPGAEVPAGSTLAVTVYAPSWMPVETVSLLENGEVIATEVCMGAAPTPCTASWSLDAEADAAYVVIAASTTQGMVGAHDGALAWAATAATLLDLDGDGWDAPLPPIEVR